MNRKEIKEFLETLHFQGYIDHDITKLENLIDDYYPKQLQQADVSSNEVVVCPLCDGRDEYIKTETGYKCAFTDCGHKWAK